MSALSEVGLGLAAVGKGLLTVVRYPVGFVTKPAFWSSRNWGLGRRTIPEDKVGETIFWDEIVNATRIVIMLLELPVAIRNIPDPQAYFAIGLLGYYCVDLGLAGLRGLGRATKH
ncbi:hypothetical protein A3H89_04380 [Candidatus Amesbacteria bacterium RIFCSPLOWO2_02_FULL_48_11]|uniref:Uncharacterized protein n=1 Tax=Candidatus Amesbacteria bacterium GW2011_GWC1_48_10 TaxID=1618365 RepID=A0A0G1UJ41_9BACT|nr:MAG: hypothetical protein UY22_C0015G0001 [Candidatus Amesbacteria bacterium GW2011_GWC1_48_10]OGD02348.1 MAG: hypothetical protein A2354_00825 [Candidatus Amesbacteria bacterium RIFOXYB1_FULL_47_12]OGD06513.1 MAG: hypothetical protein A3H89_04380 [Candidatus Amesbacteria bacterium RIFCSPLOWO2_02_FULL_48_11]